MNAKIKNACRFVKTKATNAAIVATAFVATNAIAGPMADAVKAEVTDVKTDLYAVGGIVIGLSVIGVIVGMTIHMFNRGR